MKFLWFVFFLTFILALRLSLYHGEEFVLGERINLEGYITQSPEIHSGMQVFRFNGLRIATELVPRYSYGDKIHLTGTVERKEFVSEGKKIEYFEVSEPRITSIESRHIIVRYISTIRNKITSNIQRALPSPEADLLVGVVLGDDSGFDKKTSEIFSKTGLMHIVAASGTNITIVGGLFYFSFLRALGMRKSLLISILGILIYSFLAGFSPSIQRAALMGSISYLGLFLGRQTYAILSLVFTGIVLILINPSIVIDIGFQLSFAATAGILLIQPLLQRVTFFSTNILMKDISVTLAAYIALVPLLVYHFNSFTPFSILVNAFILWTIPILTVIGGLGAIVSLVLPFVAIPILWLTYPFLHYILLSAEFFSKIFPEFRMQGTISVYFLVGYYISLISLILRFKK